MTGLTRHQTWYGRDEPPVRVRRFSAGPTTFELIGVDLHSVRYGSVELVDRVYMSVRDQNWDTIAPTVSGLRVRRSDGGSLEISFQARNRSGPLDLEWRGTISASQAGTISYEMRGRARSAFRYCRIGFCLLHSEAAAAGRRYHATTPEGIVEGRLPELVGPQLIVDGHELSLFPPCSALVVDLDGLSARADFEGSLFVMEDQRNWTDASFKTCCEAGGEYPYPALPGQDFVQRVTISATGPPATPARPRPPRVQQVGIGTVSGDGGWPALGLGMSTDVRRPLRPREARRLAALSLDHLRADVHLGSADWPAVVARAIADASATGTALELAVFGDPGTLAELDRLGAIVGNGGPAVSRLLVFDEASAANHVTPEAWLRTVAGRLARVVGPIPVHGGTDGDFAELNRERPDYAPPEGLAYSMNPQVHAFDEASLAETLASQATTVRTARDFAGGGPLAVSPVSLRQRFNPSATEAPGPVPRGVLPPTVDPRQLALFGAGWTLGSIASLAGAGAASITYFETVGWRGVMESAGQPRRVPTFPSEAGQVFPLYHVFADLAGRRTARRISLELGDSIGLVGLALRGRTAIRILVANLTPGVRELAIGPLPGGSAWVRLLDDRSYARATSAPARHRAQADRLRLRGGTGRVRLGPFAYLRLDAPLGNTLR